MHPNILATIGSPLVLIDGPPGVAVAAKLESFNPGGSAKDRPAIAMIEAAEAAGELTAGDTIVEPTSGNTGIGLAMAAAVKGYRLVVVMPASKSPERRAVMQAYGAEIELVEGEISEAKDRADALSESGEMVQLGQFENPANPDAHYRSTAEEILSAVGDRRIDALVAGVGTGGTISGIGQRLREEHPSMAVVAVEPAANAVISGEPPGEDRYQGMGAGFISPNLDEALLDGVETVPIEEAEAECRRLAREEGILVGQSSGASAVAARRVGRRLAADPTWARPPHGPVIYDGAGREVDVPASVPLVLTVFWDGGERYMSTGMFG
ncbi:MAG: PLP-dependent cysteine synthase family protein [Haloquadratum sp.]|jgi:cysteine synthase A|nr:PLP-dependent cysteine synthase family protein [Haloferacaceae archaeon]MDR9445020.1 PLP-dependent cysteine synthase family protein [Haloquadratum sp.]